MGSFAPRGHAKLDPQHPSAFAICERCGFQYLHRDLKWDTQYRGREIRRTGYLVCPTCTDIPNPTLRPIVVPADPPPILNPRSETQEVPPTTPPYKPPQIP
jgi:hypothetical protein